MTQLRQFNKMIEHVLTSETEERLYKALFTNYSKNIRPGINASEPVEIDFWLFIRRIIDVDVREQKIEVQASVFQDWNDNRLQWNPEEYDDLTSLVIEMDDVWRPDTVLDNNADRDSNGRLYQNGERNILMHDGRVQAVAYNHVLMTVCTMDITYFPMDIQNCPIEFTSRSYPDSQVTLKLFSVDTALSYHNPGWEVRSSPTETNTDHYVKGRYTTLTFHIQLKRKSTYYIINIVIPCIVISTLTTVVFILPANTGEKSSLSVSLLLATYVFHLLVADIMPKTSEEIPLILQFLFFNMLMSGFAVCLSAIASNLYSKSTDGQRVPFVVRKIMLNPYCLKVFHPKQHIPDTVKVAPADQAVKNGEHQVEINGIHSQELFLENNTQPAHPVMAQNEWQMVVTVFDRMCLVFYVLAYSLVMLIILPRVVAGY
ncbi:neuronal acetylcholine receptor subunit alpha-7-like [Glandiceps talaboti]